MAKSQRFCIYCGGSPLTKEHLYAAWLRPYVPVRTLHSHGIEAHNLWRHKPEKTVSWRAGDSHSRTIRVVCKTCNEGWMSNIQQSAKPYLIPILTNSAARLTRVAQKTLAGWAAMMVMTGEFIDREMIAIPQSERDHLRTTKLPPKGWRIWLASHTEGEGLYLWTHHVMSLTDGPAISAEPDGSRPPNTQTTTICVGQNLFVYAMSGGVAEPIIRRWNFPKTIKPLMLQIWPAAAVSLSWPPARRLATREATFVCNDFLGRVMRSLRTHGAP